LKPESVTTQTLFTSPRLLGEVGSRLRDPGEGGLSAKDRERGRTAVAALPKFKF